MHSIKSIAARIQWYYEGQRIHARIGDMDAGTEIERPDHKLVAPGERYIGYRFFAQVESTVVVDGKSYELVSHERVAGSETMIFLVGGRLVTRSYIIAVRDASTNRDEDAYLTRLISESSKDAIFARFEPSGATVYRSFDPATMAMLDADGNEVTATDDSPLPPLPERG